MPPPVKGAFMAYDLVHPVPVPLTYLIPPTIPPNIPSLAVPHGPRCATYNFL